MSRRILTILIFVIGSLIILGLSRNIWRLLQSEKKVDESQKEVERLQTEHQELLKKQAYLESEEFIEEQARNKLNMAKEGETVVILSPEAGEIVGLDNQETNEVLPNYQKWLRLFGFSK